MHCVPGFQGNRPGHSSDEQRVTAELRARTAGHREAGRLRHADVPHRQVPPVHHRHGPDGLTGSRPAGEAVDLALGGEDPADLGQDPR